MVNFISVWPYSEAPDDLRDLADRIYNILATEDEENTQCDWVAFIPKELESFREGFSVDWEGETPNEGCIVRCLESEERGGFILAGKFIDLKDDTPSLES